MSVAALLDALDLPAATRVDRRVPKTLLLENAAPTPADRRQINEGIEGLTWLAALKPTTVGVPEYRDDLREYLEVAVLHLTIRGAAKAKRLVELVHRAVPYPLLLATEHGESPGFSAVHKRWSQGQADSTVLEGAVIAADWDAERDSEQFPAFLSAMALGRQPRSTLYALYQGWIETLLALQAARVTGIFALAATAERAAARQQALQEHARLGAEIVRLRAAATKERQMARRVELNLRIKRAEAFQSDARTKL